MDFKETVVDMSKKAKDAASKTYKTVADKSSKMFEETKIKINSSDMEVEITKLFEDIGMKTLELYKSDKKVNKDTEIEKDIKKIEKLKKEIEKNEQKILLLKEQRICENCGEIIGIETRYCPYCGSKQKRITINKKKDEKKEITEKICPECKTVNMPDVNYCTKCGYKF